MTYQADYTLKTGEGTQVHFLFNTYAFRKYSERKGIELDGLLLSVQEMLQGGNGIRTKDIPDILLSAHQSYCIYNMLPFTAGEVEADTWIDEMGGLVNGVGAFSEIMKLFVARLLNIDPAKLDAKAEGEEEGEKKSQQVENVTSSVGETST